MLGDRIVVSALDSNPYNRSSDEPYITLLGYRLIKIKRNENLFSDFKSSLCPFWKIQLIDKNMRSKSLLCRKLNTWFCVRVKVILFGTTAQVLVCLNPITETVFILKKWVDHKYSLIFHNIFSADHLFRRGIVHSWTWYLGSSRLFLCFIIDWNELYVMLHCQNKGKHTGMG